MSNRAATANVGRVTRLPPVFAFAAFAAIAGLAGCSRAAPSLGPVTIDDPIAYLVQSRCPDGALEVAEPKCPGAAPQRASDPMRMRRHDWPAPAGYVAPDAVLGADGPETLWSFAPSGLFVPSHGDGGEVYVVA